MHFSGLPLSLLALADNHRHLSWRIASLLTGQGNDLRPLFPTSGPLAPTSDPLTSPCRWCLCASRWAQAVKAAATGQLEERFVPRIILESTHQNAIRDAGGISRADFERYAVGGDGVAQGGGPGPHGHGGGGGGHHGQANRGNVGR